jgi:quaternary ammonium compound-resistance protein SugE
MSWLYLILAGLCEIAFAASLKLSANFTNLKWSVLFVFFYILSILLLNKSIQGISIGTAYAVWTGIGAAGMVVVGIVYFREPADFWRMFFLSTLVLSIIGLKLVANS